MSETSTGAERAHTRLPGLLVLVLVGGAILFFLYTWPHKAHIPKDRWVCVTNLQGIGTFMRYYAIERGMPLSGDEWCDALLAIDDAVKAEILRCPLSGAKEGQCSYALNAKAAGKDPRTLPEDMVLLSDSAPGWNQVGGPELLTMDNHKGEGCCVCFADGNIQFITPERVGELRWTDDEHSPPDTD